MKEVLDPLAAALRAARRERGLSLQAVAQLMGRRSPQLVWQWEAGRHDPSLSNAREWAQALGYDLVLVPAVDR